MTQLRRMSRCRRRRGNPRHKRVLDTLVPRVSPAVNPQRMPTAAPQTHDGGMPASPAATVYPAMSPASVSPGMPGAGMPSHAAPFSPAALQSSPTRDAIDNATAVWYVRPPTGGQFGGPRPGRRHDAVHLAGRRTRDRQFAGLAKRLATVALAQTAFPRLAGSAVAAPLPQAAAAPAYAGATGYPAMPGYGQARRCTPRPKCDARGTLWCGDGPRRPDCRSDSAGRICRSERLCPARRRRRKSNDTTK